MKYVTRTLICGLPAAVFMLAGAGRTDTASSHTKPSPSVTAKTEIKEAKPAQDTLKVAPADSVDDTSHVLVRVQRLSVSGRPVNDTLLVTLQTAGRTIAGFDLKIATVSPYIRIADIFPGEIEDSCRWEYFSAKEAPVRDEPGRPRSIWQAVALAQTISDPKKPKCYGFDREASILKIVVSNSHVLQMPETTAALFFWWEDCTDNVLSGPSGEQLFMSRNVLDYYPVDIAETEGVFPNHKGALRQCVSPRSANRPKRLVVFHNGGVEWRSGIIPPDSAQSGLK
ncbi:hypothetical protein C3F09_03930 [candidate division GN15 bacterium]|uniref:Uncharacterized protein n=1 Tax=candidate division GN15 bacterium TaxID=2072418 RepID=A0A855X2T8_9BACT|nr:MAG: hypothetical protein C3F09_03930 [candidate division GN15 bacterium]